MFTSECFREFMNMNGIVHKLTPPYHPASNGAAERSVQIVKSALKKHFVSRKQGKADNRVLADFLLTYRSTPHSVTGVSPAEIFLKRQVRTRLSLLKPDLSKTVQSAQKKQKQFHDKIDKVRELNVNDPCMVRDFHSGQTERWVPGRITRQMGPRRYLVQIGQRSRFVHIDHLKRAYNLPDVNTNNDQLTIQPEMERSCPLSGQMTSNNIPAPVLTAVREERLLTPVKENWEKRVESVEDDPREITPSETIQQRRYPQRIRKAAQRLDL